MGLVGEGEIRNEEMGLSQELWKILFWIAIGNPSGSCGSQTHCSMASRSRKSGNPYSVLSTIKLIFSLNVTCSCINLFSPCPTLLSIPHTLPVPLHLEYLLHTNREYALQGLTYHIFHTIYITANKMQNQVCKFKLWKRTSEGIRVHRSPQDPVCSSLPW